MAGGPGVDGPAADRTVADMDQVDPSIAWARLRPLAEDAAIGSSKLW